MRIGVDRLIHKKWLFLGLMCMLMWIWCIRITDSVWAAENVKAVAGLDATEQKCTIQLNCGESFSGSVYRAAVWSDSNGQDDLVWYTLASGGNGLWQINCRIADHHSIGTYWVHIYCFNDLGPQLLTTTTFTVTGITCESISIINMNEENGTCEVGLEDISCPSGIHNVQVAIWSQTNQSDLVWYSAKKQSDNWWTVDMDIANHKYNLGTYWIHVYATSGNGVMEFVGTSAVIFPVINAQLSVETIDQQWHVKVSNAVHPGVIQQICFAVWSANNGQDDLVWYIENYDSSGKCGELYSDFNDHGDDGDYYVHAYARIANGTMVYLCGSQFEVKAPSAEDMSIKVDNISGKFTICLNHVQSSRWISFVAIAVWSEKNQGDLVWYQAAKQSDGSYYIDSDISMHKYHATDFKAHAYLYDTAGRPHFLLHETFSFSASVEDIGIQEIDSGLQYQLEACGVQAPAGVNRVLFAVWSIADGQDDLVWYNSHTSNVNTYSTTINLNNHKSLGTYVVHGYVELKDGSLSFLKGITFDVTELPRDNIIYYYNRNISYFDVSIRISPNISDVQSVYFPTWCDADQNDICWYQAAKVNDYVYTVNVNAANHKFHYGTYITHVYYKDHAGNMHWVTADSCVMLAPDPVTVSSCTINGDQVVLQARVDGTVSHEYGLFQLQPGQRTISASSTPLATAAGTSDITLQTPLNLNTANSLLQAKLAIGLKVGDRYLQVTSGNYITNPEAVAGQTFAFPTTSSKKGLQIHTDYMNDVNSLGVKHAVLNLTLNALFSNSSSGIAYNYNGSTYYFDSSYISYFDRITSQLSANGTVTSMVVLLQWNPATNHLIIPSGRTAGHSFYGLNTTDPAAKKQLEAAFTFLGQRYANSQHKVVNWIMGNEVADYNQYYWCGDISQEQYVEYYTDAYRMLYNSLKSVYSNARVYISLDQCWNYQRAGTYTGKTMLDSFAAKLSSEGNVSWNLAFHPYPFPLTSANFWNSSSLIQDNANSPIITMKNLRSLTDYIKYTYGSDKRFILSETGFTSVSNGTKDEILQAAAIAYAYYLAEFNDMVDAFVVHRHVDHRVEMNMGLYLGLWANENGSEETPTRQKYSWVVFQKMDTNQSLLYTNFALPYIGASDWYSVVPGFNPGRFQ